MNSLNIQQGLNVEVVSTNLIKKLYEAALSVPEPLEGELDAAYMSGNLLVDKSYRSLVEYLTNRFDDLHINVTAGYYMLFHDSAVNNVLKNTIGDGVGVLIEEFLSITNDSLLGLGPSATAHPEITDFREACLLTGLTLFNNGIHALTGLTFFGFPPNVTNFSNIFASGLRFDGIVVKNWNNFINRQETSSWWENGYYVYNMDSNGNLTRIDTLTLPSNVTFPNDISWKYQLSGIKLEELVIPAGMTRFGLAAGNGIKKISFEPNSTLTTIDFGFHVNDNISSSIVQLDVANLPLTITTIGANAFKRCSNVTGVLDLHNLTSLGQYSFFACHITGATDLGSITEIPYNCFLYSTLLSITLPSTCTTIKSRGLSDMTTLTTVSGGSGLTTIEDYAFYNDTNLATIDLSNVTNIGEAAFYNCPISTVDLSSIVELGGDSFYRLTSISTSSVKLGHSCSKLAKWALRSLKDPTAVLYFPLITTYLNKESLNPSNFLTGLMGQSALGLFAYNNSRVTWGLIYLPNLASAASGWTSFPNYFGLFAGLEVDIIYIKNLSTFPLGMVGGAKIKALVIDSTTPPTLTINSGTDSFYNCNEIINIYVPDGYESVYESAWSNVTTFSLTGKIKPISDLTTYNTEADWIEAGRPLGLITAYMS